MNMDRAAFKLLLVEDNPGDADLTREHLEGLPDCDFEITLVTRLADAITKLEESPIDAVILDLNLPDSTGLDTLRRLRQIRSAMAIIVLSGVADDILRRDAIREGAQEFLSKNESASRLVARSFVYALERHRKEEESRKIEQLVAANPDAVLVVDDANIVRFANVAALSLFGRSNEEFVDHPLGYSIPVNEMAEISFTKGGKTHFAEMRAAQFVWDRKRAYLASIRDITEKKHLAEQLLQSQKMEAMGLLAGGVAHDLNNLLTVIVNCAMFLNDAITEDDPKHNDVNQILAAVDRAEALIGQLLELSRRKPTQARIIGLGEVATEMEKLLRRTLPADIELSVEITGPLWTVLADRGRIEQVLMNLAVNAKDAMQGGGRITIALANKTLEKATGVCAAGDYVSLSVADTGTGIPPETLSRIFEPFFTTKAPGKGTGLGLATCYSIVQQAGGEITVQSRLGDGTRFEILLPRADGAVVSAAIESSDKPAPGGTESILLVDDDVPVATTLATVLQKKGYTVVLAENGEEALLRVQINPQPFDLVLSDIIMPRMNGRALTKALRERYPHQKILLMSGFDDAPGDNPEAVETIFKPFRPNDLLKRVRDILDAKNKIQSG
jgi:two-component system cell cycle sensor histidine kinase/response regulator CckA